VWDKALAYWRQAGEKALARSAHRAAVGAFEQALRTLPHLPEQHSMYEQAIDLRLAMRTALLPSGARWRGGDILREAESLAMSLGYPRRRGQVLLFQGFFFHPRGA